MSKLAIKSLRKMAENIPEILVDELKNADINRRVNTLELTDNQGEKSYLRINAT
ncbi:YjeJ family protein [Escherichia coli]